MREFPPCKSRGYCDLVGQGDSSFNCTTDISGTRCDVICDHQYAGRFSCYPGSDWVPQLPYCMRPKGMEEQQACNCGYGRSCDHYGNCVCPDGTTGRYCETSFCSDLNAPKSGSRTCSTIDRQRTCVGSCLPGYSFEGREAEAEITVTCVEGQYTPLRQFPPCKSDGYCDLVGQGTGSFNCTSDMTGTRCDVICDGRYAGRYSCYPGREWQPQLPYCVRPKDVGRTQTCHCEYGGRCDPHGHCLCPIARTGRFCETGVEEIQTCPCEYGGSCDPYGHCLCPSGRTGRFCETNVREIRTCRCEYGGSCDPYGNCICPIGRTGRLCETTIPEVNQIFCRDPGTDSNGRRNPRFPPGGQGFLPGTPLEYSCNRGYSLVGERNVVCLTTGEWSNERPRCNAHSRGQANPEIPQIFCRDPGTVSNGLRNPRLPPTGQGFRPGTQLGYSCNQGYNLDGERNIVCLATGAWSSESPRCNAQPREPANPERNQIFCRDPGMVSNGRRNPRFPPTGQGFPPGTWLQYSCNQGYDLDGEESIYCFETGEWSSERPRCNAKPREPVVDPTYCGNPGPISNGRVEFYSPSDTRGVQVTLDDSAYPRGTRLEYICDDGYTLEGSIFLTCRGIWSAEKPTCRRRDVEPTYCPNPGSIANGRVVYYAPLNSEEDAQSQAKLNDSQLPQGAGLEFSCDDEYTLEGNFFLTCGANGVWTAEPPTCRRGFA